MNPKTALIPLLLGALLPSQTIVVNPGGGGTYTDLQTAIDAAPTNAVIHVVGGSWEALTVTRSLTIVAEPAAVISQTSTMGIGQQPAAITLQGNGGDRFTLVNAYLSGSIDCLSWNYAGAGIDSTGFNEIRLFESGVHGAEWYCVTGQAGGASGIRAPDATTIYLERSTVEASAAVPGTTHSFGLDGVPAIDAPNATVVVAQSRVFGGDCEASRWPNWAPSPTACACPAAAGHSGAGGPGIVAANLLDIGGLIRGGAGAEVFWMNQPWGQQPDGPATVVGNTDQLDVSMVLASELALGSTGRVAFSFTQNPALFVVGMPSFQPQTVASVSPVFVDSNQPFATQFLPLNSQSISTPVPSWSGLIGLAMAHQRFDLVAGNIVPSNPVVAVIRP